FQLSQHSFKERRAGIARMPVQIEKTVFRGTGKPSREVFLMLGEDIDRKPRTGNKVAQNGVSQIDAHQYERRIERNRRERIHRHSMRVTVAVERRNYGDTGREAGAGPAIKP